jgi:hypothetical protein
MIYIRNGIIGLALVGLVGQAAAQASSPGDEPQNVDPRRGTIAPPAQLTLTPEQKTAIFDAVQPAEAKVKAQNVPATVGAQVPPATELYFLPDRALAIAPEAKATKYTVAQNRVVLGGRCHSAVRQRPEIRAPQSDLWVRWSSSSRDGIRRP